MADNITKRAGVKGMQVAEGGAKQWQEGLGGGSRGCTGEFPSTSMYAKNIKKDKPTNHISCPPQILLISDLNASSQYQCIGQYFTKFALHTPSFGKIMAHWHGLSMPLHCQNSSQICMTQSKIDLHTNFHIAMMIQWPHNQLHCVVSGTA